VAVLRPTVTAALAMEYPHRTYVLDDGRRPEVRQLCAELGATYMTREDNRHAKAGNINAALPKTDGEFIAFFDADHAPFRGFLQELLGYFRDPEVGLVQAPQAYYNLDSFQHGARQVGRSPWHEQSIFYDAILPGKDRWNAAFWCGSSAIVRRAALEEVGGVDTRTVTEDMHTSMCMNAAGWRSVYDPRELAIGIAPDDAGAFLTQRSRWAKGALQILRLDNPLRKPGLDWRQRISYFSSVAYVFEYVPKLVYMVTPIVALLSGQLPMRHLGWLFLLAFVAYWAIGVYASRLLTDGRNPYFESERYHLLKLGIMLSATLTLVFPSGLKFKVTPKSGDGRDHRLEDLRFIRVPLAIGLLSMLAVAWAGASWLTGARWQLQGWPLVVTAGWAVMNAGLVASLARTVLQKHHRRQAYRFAVDVPASVEFGDARGLGRVRDVSAVGLGFTSGLQLSRGDEVRLWVRPPENEPVSLVAEVLSVGRAEDGYRYGAEFRSFVPGARERLILWLYQQHAPGLFAAADSGLSPAAAAQRLQPQEHVAAA
jgi:cellulose synthase (UDP-forming)